MGNGSGSPPVVSFDVDVAERPPKRRTHPSRHIADVDLKDKVRFLEPTTEKLIKIAQYLYRTNGRYDDTVAAMSAQELGEVVLASVPTTLEVGDFGAVVTFFPYRPGHEAAIHVAAWDPTLFRRPQLGRAILRFAFKKWDLRRIYALIPEPNRLANRLAKTMNLQPEGRIRHAFVYNGRPVDGMLWGILREEVLD